MSRVARAMVAGWVVIAVGLVVQMTEAADPPEIPLSIEQHRFSPAEVRVKAGAPFVLIITNKDSSPEEFESKDLRVEKVIPANKTLRVRMPGLKPGTYPFIGEYNEATAKGKIIAE